MTHSNLQGQYNRNEAGTTSLNSTNSANPANPTNSTNPATTFTAGTEPLRVAVTDNDNFALMTMVGLLPHVMPGCKVVWSTTSATEAIAKATDPSLMPDVLMLDMALGSTYTGPKVCRAIREATAKVKVLGITSYSLEHYAADMAKAGAQGLVAKSDIPQIEAALQAVSHGETYSVLPNISFLPADEAHRRIVADPKDDAPELTTREAQIMERLSTGKRYREIADEFGVSGSSVRTEAQRAIKKLGASTLSQGVGIWMLERR